MTMIMIMMMVMMLMMILIVINFQRCAILTVESEATAKEVSVFATKAGEVQSCLFFICLFICKFLKKIPKLYELLLGENCAVQRCDPRCSAHGVCSNGESSFSKLDEEM